MTRCSILAVLGIILSLFWAIKLCLDFNKYF